MVGSLRTVIRETRRDRTVFVAPGPKSRPPGVRAIQGTQESGWPMNRNGEKIKTTPAPVTAMSKQAGEAPARRDP